MPISNSDILYEDNHLIAINKKAGELVQPDKSGGESLEESVKQFLKVKYNKEGNVFLGVTHRIDRPVSGLVLMAKSAKALSRLNQMMQDHKFKKTYWAITANKPESDEGKLVHFIRRNEQKNMSSAFKKEVTGSKLAELNYKVIAKSERYFLLEIELITGRHHQIRAQLSAIGCSIKGDLKYGFNRSNPDGSISLHSREISFVHPVSQQKLTINAPVPNEKLWLHFQLTMK
ncbi:MAG: RluA family pseudouridine synthase [Bacteroidia bacterium]|nr:RluA family pseudouridine synthase [Bacteroidia bacterium]